MSSNYSESIAGAIEGFLMEDDWKYVPLDERGIIRMSLSTHSKLKTLNIFINVCDNCYSVITSLPVGADDNTKAAAAEFITRANYGIMHGNFEMDFDDGEIRYKTSLYCGDTLPTYEQVRQSIYVNTLTVERYGDELLKVLYGFATPEEAIAEVEGK